MIKQPVKCSRPRTTCSKTTTQAIQYSGGSSTSGSGPGRTHQMYTAMRESAASGAVLLLLRYAIDRVRWEICWGGSEERGAARRSLREKVRCGPFFASQSHSTTLNLGARPKKSPHARRKGKPTPSAPTPHWMISGALIKRGSPVCCLFKLLLPKLAWVVCVYHYQKARRRAA